MRALKAVGFTLAMGLLAILAVILFFAGAAAFGYLAELVFDGNHWIVGSVGGILWLAFLGGIIFGISVVREL